MHSTNIFVNDEFEFSVDGVEYVFQGELDVQFSWVDFGIGRYEYGSQVCYDSRMGVEEVIVEDFWMGSINYKDDEGDWDEVPKDRWDELKPTILKALNECEPLIEYVAERVEPEEYDDY